MTPAENLAHARMWIEPTLVGWFGQDEMSDPFVIEFAIKLSQRIVAAVEAKGEADAVGIARWVRSCAHEARRELCEWRSALDEARGCVRQHATDVPLPPGAS